MINWERVATVGFILAAALAVASLLVFRHKHPAPLPPVHALVQAAPVQPRPVRTAPVAVHKPIYRRVLPGGKIDGQIDCKAVRSMTNSYADVQAYGPSVAGLSADTVRRLRVCFP